MTYEIKYTDLATAFLGDRKAAFEEQARGELAAETKEPTKIIIHCIEYNGRWFGCIGKDDYVLIDTITFKEGPE